MALGTGRRSRLPMDDGVLRERPAALGTKVYWPLSEGLWIPLEKAVLSFPLGLYKQNAWLLPVLRDEKAY